MKIHYFQRYHSKENVATANTMLLLSRLYSYSSDKFFSFLKSQYFSDSFEPEISFTLQKKNNESIPDAIISQESFKIVVETKMSDWFHTDQLIHHLGSFSNEKYKVLLTLAPVLMNDKTKSEFETELAEYNRANSCCIMHINTTFEELANAVSDVIDDRDYDMLSVLEDYIDYCNTDKLIISSDSWKYVRMQLSNATFEYNFVHNMYWVRSSVNFRSTDYIGLYRNKSMCAIGKISSIIIFSPDDDEKFAVQKGKLTEEQKALIFDAAAKYSITEPHRIYFVEKYFQTDFRKITQGAPMGGRVFDLTQILGTTELPNTEKIAEQLKKKTWN